MRGSYYLHLHRKSPKLSGLKLPQIFSYLLVSVHQEFRKGLIHGSGRDNSWGHPQRVAGDEIVAGRVEVYKSSWGTADISFFSCNPRVSPSSFSVWGVLTTWKPSQWHHLTWKYSHITCPKTLKSFLITESVWGLRSP